MTFKELIDYEELKDFLWENRGILFLFFLFCIFCISISLIIAKETN